MIEALKWERVIFITVQYAVRCVSRNIYRPLDGVLPLDILRCHSPLVRTTWQLHDTWRAATRYSVHLHAMISFGQVEAIQGRIAHQ